MSNVFLKKMQEALENEEFNSEVADRINSINEKVDEFEKKGNINDINEKYKNDDIKDVEFDDTDIKYKNECLSVISELLNIDNEIDKQKEDMVNKIKEIVNYDLNKFDDVEKEFVEEKINYLKSKY